MDSPENRRVKFAEFELDLAHRKLFRHGEPVAVYAKAFDLLVFLIEHNGKVVSKGEILDKVWADQFVEEANLSVQISALRKALGESKNQTRFLVTVPGVGYKFVADVQWLDDEVLTVATTLDGLPSANTEEDAPEPRPKRSGHFQSNRRRWIAAFAVFAIASALMAGYFYWPRKLQITSLAVLPFVLAEQNTEQAYLGEGLADSVIHSMSGISDLRVVSRNSAFRFQGNETDAKPIGRELDVDAILTGRIVNQGDNLSVRAELISTRDNSVIWGESFTRRPADIERFQTDIAQAIAEKLRLKLSNTGARRVDGQKTADPEAYRLYLLGRFHLNKFTDEGFFKGREYFQQAIEKDPNFALAYVGLAEAYNRLCGYNAMPSSECFPKSRIAAERALELDDGLADAHAMLASVRHFYDWDFPGAEKSFRRSIEIDPNNAQAHQLFSYHLTAMTRFEESLAEVRRAHELDPLSIEKTVGIAEVLYFQRLYDEALEQAHRALELDRNASFVHWLIGNIYLQKGMLDEAIAQYEKSIPLSGDSPDEQASLAYAYAVAGRKEEARQILQKLKQRANGQFISPCALAIVYTGLNEKDEAFEWLERGYGSRDFILTLLKIEPTFDRLRDDPRFRDLMRRVGF